MKTESEKIVDALGGSTKLARLLGLTVPAVQSWKKRGIPARIQLDHPKLIAKGRRLVARSEKVA